MKFLVDNNLSPLLADALIGELRFCRMQRLKLRTKVARLGRLPAWRKIGRR